MHRPATSSMIPSSKNNKKGFFELSVTEQKHFDSDEIFRSGGDEFVVVMPQVSEGTFAQHVERLRKKSKKISMAIGSVWSEKCLDVEELVNIADKNMYADKTEFYSKNDRRKE